MGAPPSRIGASTTPLDVVEALERLLWEAKHGDGELIGLAWAVVYRRRRFAVDTAGEARRDPIYTRGMLRVLDDQLGELVGSRPN